MFISQKKVIIVGGGISGIKAAVELNKYGIDYVILEAKDHLGGRLKTIQGKNFKYDLGASWFHETLNNALFDEEIKLSKDGKFPFYYDDAPVKVIDENGDVSPFLKLASIRQEVYKYIEILNGENLESDRSLFDAVIQYLKERKHLLTRDQITHVLGYIRALELWHGIDVKILSSKYSSIENEGRDAYCLHYDRILKRHTAQLDYAKVCLNTVVKSIEKIGKGKQVKITSAKGEEFIGDYVIVTVPQSILQLTQGEEGYISFTPPLPKRLSDSLKEIHFGALGKVIFEFEEVFWPTDSERTLVLSTVPDGFFEAILEDNDQVPSYSRDYPPKAFQYPSVVLNLATTFKVPSLLFLTQHPLTDYLEANPSKVFEFFKPTLQRLSGQEEIPTPINEIVSGWTQDPYQRGSYSACMPGDDPLSPILAFEEGFGNIRFAGEHTILEGAGSVHGAWNSGTREANYIKNDLKL